MRACAHMRLRAPPCALTRVKRTMLAGMCVLSGPTFCHVALHATGSPTTSAIAQLIAQVLKILDNESSEAAAKCSHVVHLIEAPVAHVPFGVDSIVLTEMIGRRACARSS